MYIKTYRYVYRYVLVQKGSNYTTEAATDIRVQKLECTELQTVYVQ